MARLISTLFLLTAALTQFASPARVTNSNKVPKNAVLLSQVQTLTVRSGHNTASRRVSPVPQLTCAGPSHVCKLYEVDVMRCTNEGSDYDQENVQWACRTSLPEEFKLGSTDVTCEGYESSQDPYILKGSCGVQYRLLLTEKGEEKYGSKQTVRQGQATSESESYVGYIFMIVFLLVLFIILYNLYQAWQNDGPRQGGRRLGYGGGGGGFDDNDPPPPYDPYLPRRDPPRASKPKPSTRASSSRTSGGNRQQQGWRPGFWTGAMTGAAAGYLAGNRNQAQPQPETTDRRQGGGLFGGAGRGSTWTQQPSSPVSPSSSTPSYSSSRHESTGFGSTSRR